MNVAKNGLWELERRKDGTYIIKIKYSITNFLFEEIDEGRIAAYYDEEGRFISYQAEGAFPEDAYAYFKVGLQGSEVEKVLREVTYIYQMTESDLQLMISKVVTGDVVVEVSFVIKGCESLEFRAQIKKDQVWCYEVVYNEPKGVFATIDLFEDKPFIFEKIKNDPKIRLKLIYRQ